MAELTTYTLTEIADILKVSQKTVYRYVRDGKIPATKVGRQWRITEQALKEYLKVK